MKPPCPSHIFVIPGKPGRADIEWNKVTRSWDTVNPLPDGAVAWYCEAGDKGHEGTCVGGRSEGEYKRLLAASHKRKEVSA